MLASLKRLWCVSRLPALALAIAATAVLAYEVYPKRAAPRSVAELVGRLRAAGLDVRVVPVVRATQDPESGAFLCERDRPWEELFPLQRAAECRGDWAGVVHAQRWPHDEDAVAFILREWQGCSARVGEVLLFGDPDLLRRIVDALER
jgi:hypothetical protein